MKRQRGRPRKVTKEQELSEYIQGRRKSLGLREADIAKELGISQQATHQRIESGNFSYSMLLVIFKVLETTDEEKLRLLA